MARRASCTRSSGTRHGFLPSILEKVAAPSQHRHQRQCIAAASLHRRFAFHLFRACACGLLPLPSLRPARTCCAVAPQQQQLTHRAGARRGIKRRSWGPGLMHSPLTARRGAAQRCEKAQGECTRNVTAVTVQYSRDRGLAIGGPAPFAISPSVIGRGKCLGVQVRERRAEQQSRPGESDWPLSSDSDTLPSSPEASLARAAVR